MARGAETDLELGVPRGSFTLPGLQVRTTSLQNQRAGLHSDLLRGLISLTAIVMGSSSPPDHSCEV